MATNLHKDVPRYAVAVTHPATPNSGDPVRVGVMPGVALGDEDAGGLSGGLTLVDFGRKIWNLNVDDNVGSGISPGDKLYYHDTGTGSPTTSINNTATAADAEFGIALGTLGANATGTIPVLVTATT